MRDLSNKEQDFDGQKCNLNVIWIIILNFDFGS